MPDIRLQDYVVQIKELIRSVRLDEAIAHCQHILRHYPKYIEAYSLLGEACLEKEMYREAIEFFQRTLGADPENLIARVGLGVIYDEQGAFPEAIWQLERAFELVPGNAEVRRELLRLYGQYDEIDKTRLKLTRGALGRLYSRNGLYERAIGEFHAVLRQDPELPDIRVALVEALWREGRQLETVEMCMELLDALPNCLKANLILGDIWLRGSNEESAEQRLSVVRALDPEHKVAQELMGKDSPLPPEDVRIPELDAIPDGFDFAPSGVPGAGAIVAAEAVEMVAAGAPDEEDQEPWSTDEELPEWLRDVGVTAEEEPALELLPDDAVLDPPPDESIPAEDMPEWLQEVMGEEGIPTTGEPVTVEGETFDDEFVAGEESLEPLQEIESPDLADAAAAATKVGLAGGAAIAAGLVAAGMMDDEDQESTGDETPAEEIPEWLEELVSEPAPPLGEEPVPEVEEFAAPSVAEEETPAIEEESLPDDEASPDGEAPDWLGELDTAEVAGVAALAIAAGEEETLPDGEVLDWLRDLDAAEVEEIAAPSVDEVEDEPSAFEEEALPDDEAPPDGEIPDWLRDLGVAGAAGVAGAVAAAALREDEVEAEEITALPVAEVEEEALLADEAPPDGEVPDWLLELDAADVEEAAEPLVAEVEMEEIAVLPVAEVEEEAMPADEAPPDDEIPDWLLDLDAADVEEAAEPLVAEVEMEEIAALPVAEVEEEALLADEAPPDGEVPDWLLELDAADVEEAAEPLVAEVEMEEIAVLPVAEVEEEAMPADEAPPDGEVPDWLSDLGAAGAAGVVGAVGVAALRDDESEAEEEALPADEAPPDDEIPDWLLDLDAADVEEAAEPLVAEVEMEEISALPVVEAEEAPAVTEEVPLIDEIPDWLRDLDAAEVEEVAASPFTEVGAEAVQEGAVPASLLALVAAGLLDESDLESAMAEMSDEELDAQRAEEVPEWLSELVEEEPAVVEAEPAPGTPFIQEITTPVTETPVDEVPPDAEPEAEVFVEEAVLEVAEPEAEALVEEAVLEVAEPEAEALVEEAVLEVAEPEPEALVEEAVLEAAEPEAEMLIEEAVLEVAEPEVEVLVEEAALEVVEPEPEVLIEEAVLEVAEPEAEVLIEEAVLEVAEPEAEALIEEAVLEAAEPEAEVFVEEAVLEIAEPEAEALVEEAVLEVAEPEAEALVEEAVLEVAEPEAEALIEEAVLEAAEPEAEALVEEAALEVAEPEAGVIVEEVAPDAVEPEAEPLVEEAVLEIAEEEIEAPSREDELLKQLKTRPRDYSSRLELARLYYDDQDWDAALPNYEKLISARRFLPDIVDDLESLAEQDVEPARVYHMLGDAYMQQDQLDEALEMYRLARQKLTNR